MLGQDGPSSVQPSSLSPSITTMEIVEFQFNKATNEVGGPGFFPCRQYMTIEDWVSSEEWVLECRWIAPDTLRIIPSSSLTLVSDGQSRNKSKCWQK